ncbi:hypothetical protein E2C01_046514 [Portunus trituberculatus]|uniref:Uncharacterized protein n=1 Tax=Portunus trituberculatus TaxID=210409 RepID=A0A5B7G4Z8_PORTR|nr:hypothetical protein [Portunus trituberculatus]
MPISIACLPLCHAHALLLIFVLAYTPLSTPPRHAHALLPIFVLVGCLDIHAPFNSTLSRPATPTSTLHTPPSARPPSCQNLTILEFGEIQKEDQRKTKEEEEEEEEGEKQQYSLHWFVQEVNNTKLLLHLSQIPSLGYFTDTFPLPFTSLTRTASLNQLAAGTASRYNTNIFAFILGVEEWRSGGNEERSGGVEGKVSRDGGKENVSSSPRLPCPDVKITSDVTPSWDTPMSLPGRPHMPLPISDPPSPTPPIPSSPPLSHPKKS